MGEHRKQPKQHAKVAKPRTDRNKKEFQDTEGCGKFFIRDRKGTECGKGDHNHHDRTDQIRLYRCLSDDQSSHDSDGISHCTGSRTPASRKSSNDNSMMSTSTTAGNGTPCLASANDKSSVVGVSVYEN